MTARDALEQLDARPWCVVDFETADRSRDSICSFAIVGVERGQVRYARHQLTCPETRRFSNTSVHGITKGDVAEASSVATVVDDISTLVQRVEAVVAWRAAFDRSVLIAACGRYAVTAPSTPFICAHQLVEDWLKTPVASLAWACAQVGIDHQPHDALSDAMACAHLTLLACRAHRSGAEGPRPPEASTTDSNLHPKETP